MLRAASRLTRGGLRQDMLAVADVVLAKRDAGLVCMASREQGPGCRGKAHLGDGGTQVGVNAHQVEGSLAADAVQEPLQVAVADAKFGAGQPCGHVRMHLRTQQGSCLWPFSAG